MINDDGEESLFSEKSNPVKIIPPASQQVLPMTRDVKGPSKMPLKKLILKENRVARDEMGKTRKLFLGNNVFHILIKHTTLKLFRDLFVSSRHNDSTNVQRAKVNTRKYEGTD